MDWDPGRVIMTLTACWLCYRQGRREGGQEVLDEWGKEARPKSGRVFSDATIYRATRGYRTARIKAALGIGGWRYCRELGVVVRIDGTSLQREQAREVKAVGLLIDEGDQ